MNYSLIQSGALVMLLHAASGSTLNMHGHDANDKWREAELKMHLAKLAELMGMEVVERAEATA